MPNYRLKFAADGAGRDSALDSDALDFDAVDPSAALILAQRHGAGRTAELWSGAQLVCRMAVAPDGGFWEIG